MRALVSVALVLMGSLVAQIPDPTDAPKPFEMAPGTMGEHWVCDGNSVYEINHQTKQLIETKLPPDMRGKAIAEGPLPFMFGAKKDTIRARYWIREIPRKQAADPYHLEFVPKAGV